jgi:O-antigen/teichoic acid export membrane protein
VNQTDPTPETTAAQHLREAAFRGVRWVLLARVGGEICAFASAVTLARLIPPAEFGRASVALALVPLAVILTFEGCASALVQREEITPQHEDAAVIMSLLLGLVLSLLTFLVAAVAGPPVFGHRTAQLVEFASPVFLLASFGAVPRALLWRRLELRRVSIIEVVTLFLGATVSVVMALAGYDAEAIIAGALAATAGSSVLLFASSPFSVKRLRHREAREVAGFGIPAALAGLVGVGFSNVDYVILAARLSATHAGLYWRAFQLGVSYQEKVSGVMLRLAFPVYARTSDAAELRRLHERATRLHATVLLPLLGVLIVTAPVLVPWMFGPAWAPAVVPTQILAVAGMIAAVLTGYPQVMLAVGQPKALLRFNLVVLGCYMAVILVAVRFGLTVVCLSVVGSHIVLLFAVYRVLLKRYVGVPLRALWSHLLPSLVGCLALLAAGFPLRELLQAGSVPAVPSLALLGLACLTVYLLTVRAAFPAAWDDVRLVTKRVFPGRRRGPVADGTAVPAFNPGGN